ncbi:glycosyltransferase [Bradyrhizobium sp. CB82]|uniref:glycosyltransferase family 2 protein n=1 Tax=Bradyrhizobium sp. CB82 TaxID=3039159 RepID=UPI0024B1AB5F|nr:glycosyltransferase [Bradyrhizobium sp. CB82]WFU37357.1 glycosyltransferase [Bradyrhizobium sp. CB82]
MRAAIDSALAQSWPATEVIVVNDGSADGGATAEIARSYGDRIHYIEKPNGGVASALNAGISAMKGDVFCWLSHDDRHWPNKIERQMAEWEKRGHSDIVLISDYRLINEHSDTIADVRLAHETLAAKPQYTLLRGSIHGCSVFVPRKLFAKVGTFDESLPTTQDYDLWHRMQRAGIEFVHMPEILIDSRWHAEQGSKKINHIHEATQFWLRVVKDIGVDEREALEGSNFRFLAQMADFLATNGLTDAADCLMEQANQGLSDILVSIIIPTYNRYHLLAGAISSALKQTHRRIEIIVVDDGSTDDACSLETIVARHASHIRLLRQANSGPAAARNRGWMAARGKYVAFLDSDDLFLPHKIESQLRFMEATCAAFSHTSYFRHWARKRGLVRINSGAGNKFPQIIGGCGIATPTVMMLNNLKDNFQFPEGVRLGEDIILWLRVAAKHGIEGLDSALTVVRASQESTGYDTSKLSKGIANILAAVREDVDLARHETEVARLAHAANTIEAPTI